MRLDDKAEKMRYFDLKNRISRIALLHFQILHDSTRTVLVTWNSRPILEQTRPAQEFDLGQSHSVAPSGAKCCQATCLSLYAFIKFALYTRPFLLAREKKRQYGMAAHGLQLRMETLNPSIPQPLLENRERS